MCELGTIWRFGGVGLGWVGLAGPGCCGGPGVKKNPGAGPGLLLGVAGSVVTALVEILVNEAELGPLVENVERGLELL